MKSVTNHFGAANVCDESDFLEGKVYATCAACMSIYAEFSSWANAHARRMTLVAEEAANIIVLSCQVTDLAVLNDLRTVEALQRCYPSKRFFVGGCLANRFDIPLPKGVQRLEQLRADYQQLDKQLVHFAAPFWVRDFEEGGPALRPGHLFRDQYPLRIGVGCSRHCKYCTIRHTRGPGYCLSNDALLECEFLNHESVLLIADSPTAQQIAEWCRRAIRFTKPISLRNVEPAVGLAVWDDLMAASLRGFLTIYHSPIQSDQEATLRRMGRPVAETLEFIRRVPEMKAQGTICATNIIVDYEDCPDPSDEVYRLFDYVSWNPYWDGKWDRAVAEARFEKYLATPSSRPARNTSEERS